MLKQPISNPDNIDKTGSLLIFSKSNEKHVFFIVVINSPNLSDFIVDHQNPLASLPPMWRISGLLNREMSQGVSLHGDRLDHLASAYRNFLKEGVWREIFDQSIIINTAWEG